VSQHLVLDDLLQRLPACSEITRPAIDAVKAAAVEHCDERERGVPDERLRACRCLRWGGRAPVSSCGPRTQPGDDE